MRNYWEGFRTSRNDTPPYPHDSQKNLYFYVENTYVANTY